MQEFLPDRLKMTAQLSSEVAEGWVSPQDLKARVNRCRTCSARRPRTAASTATLTLSPAYPAFRSHARLPFYDPQRAKEGYSEKLADGKTNDKGDAEFDLDLDSASRAPPTGCTCWRRAFEAEGGRSVSAETATLVSELPFLVGYKADGDLGYVVEGREARRLADRHRPDGEEDRGRRTHAATASSASSSRC